MREARGPSGATCDLVDRRDREACRRCGRRIAGGSRHHRQLRRFGDHSAANLVLLCGSGTTGCHGWVHAHPAEAYRLGWLVHSWHDPAQVPVVGVGGSGGWVLLDRDGKAAGMTVDDARKRLTDLGLA